MSLPVNRGYDRCSFAQLRTQKGIRVWQEISDIFMLETAI
jgi:hypothetical protein